MRVLRRTWHPVTPWIADGPTGSSLLLGTVALMIVAALGYLAVPRASDGLALYQRASAPHDACKAAANAIVALHKDQSTIFLDDCAAPIVTRVSNQRGHLIVTRVVDAGKRQLATYSVLVDGNASDAWLVLEVRRAPNKLTLDASLLTTNGAAIPEQAQQ
ncbi:MAG: hypothetical protein ISP45_18270 [Reyranella sp.]|nr:hypothetical protein [Reyranella sp.]